MTINIEEKLWVLSFYEMSVKFSQIVVFVRVIRHRATAEGNMNPDLLVSALPITYITTRI